MGEALQYIKGGTPIRLLGQMSAGRTVLAPDLATFKEQGFPIELASLRGLGAPKGLPADVRVRLVDAVARAAADPDYMRSAREMFAPTRYLAPDTYAAELQAGDAQFRQLWKEMPWKE